MDKILASGNAALTHACEAVLQGVCDYWDDGPDFGSLNVLFSLFSLTGVLPSDVPIASCPPGPRPTKLSSGSCTCPNVFSWLAAVAQRRALAKIARTTEREVECWLSLLSLAIFDRMKRLAIKVMRGKASLEEKDAFGRALVVFLFASGICSTYVLEAAQRTLSELKVYGKRALSTGLTDGLFLLGQYVYTLLEKREHLRLWTRHWLRKLYGGSKQDSGLLRPIVFSTLLTTMNCEPGFRSGSVREAFRKNKGGFPPELNAKRSGAEVNANKNTTKEDIPGNTTGRRYQRDDCRDGHGPYPHGIRVIAELMAALPDFFSCFGNKENMQRNLDFLAQRTFPQIELSEAELSAETFDVNLKLDIVLEGPDGLDKPKFAALEMLREHQSQNFANIPFEEFCFRYMACRFTGLI